MKPQIIAAGFVLLLAGCGNDGATLSGTARPGLNVAQAAMSAGSPDIALNVASAILAKEPGNVAALVARGDALSALNQPATAEASYAKALTIDHGSIGAQVGLGRLTVRNDPSRAQLLFLGVLQADPRNAAALNDLGIAYDLQGKHASAQSAYRQALSADTTMRAAEVNLALSMALSGQAAEAARLLKPLASDPAASRQVHHDMAAVLAIAGDKPAAVRILSADLTPEQVERAVAAYGALGP